MDVDLRTDIMAGDLLARTPMVLIVLDGDGRIVLATGSHLAEVLGPTGLIVGRLLSDLSDIATILLDLVARALDGAATVGRLGLANGFLQLRVTPSLDDSGAVAGAVVLGMPELPCVSSDEAFPGGSKSTASAQPSRDKGDVDDRLALVLVVEDNGDMAHFVTECLADGHSVVVATDGEEGLARARAMRPDVVLMDVMMPRMGGDMLVAALRAEPGLEGARVLVFVEKTDEAFGANTLVEGAHDFITKPFSMAELRARVAHQVFVKRREDARMSAASALERVTDRMYRQLQQAQKMEAIGRLAAGVAHDFNNLLTVIGGYATLLVDTPAEPTLVRELAQEIKDASDRAAALTRQLLTFGRKQVVHPVVTDPNDTILGLENMFHHLAGDAIALSFELSDEPCLVHMDPTQLDQVLINLVINARDAMPRGGRLVVRTTAFECGSDADCILFDEDLPAGGYVSVEVADTGDGVSPEALEHIFEPFYSTKDFGKGTGLGLAIVHGIVEQSGGRVTCESEVGRGSVFRLCLPRLVGAAEARQASTPTARPTGGGRRILVVDDDTSVREFVARSLVDLGYAVVLATSGVDALRQVADGLAPVDLVITDVTMPELDGPGLAARLASLWPAVPVIFVSGSMDDGPMREVSHGRVARLLEKPFTAAELERVVRRALGSAGG